MPRANGYRAASVSRRRPGVEVPAPVRTCPCESGSHAGKCRPGADDRQSAGSASHRARRDGLSMHAGRLRERHSTGDAPNRGDRGLLAAVCSDRSFFSPYQSDACSGNRTKPVPRRSGDDTPCSPERSCRAALRRRIPADCVLAGTDSVPCRTGRTVHRRLSHAHCRKERASVARARPDKGVIGQRGGRNGCRRREVTKLKHAARGMRSPRRGPAVPDKAEQCSATFLPTESRPFTPICRANLRGCRSEMFHARYMAQAARESQVVRASIGRRHRYTAKPVRVMFASEPFAGA